ncbi:MAG: CsgG/HfaB family protein [Burkholderiaceae bacterium]
MNPQQTSCLARVANQIVFFTTCAFMSITFAQAEDASSNVEKCSRNMGSIAVSEAQGSGATQLSSYGLGSPVAVLRLMIQQSGCFAVVERGVAMQNLQQERALSQNGEMRSGSNIGKGQMQAADFVMTPNIQFAQNTGGVGGALASWGGGLLGKVGALAGGLKFKEAQTSLIIADVRSSIQIAAAEGTAKKTDFAISGWSWGGGGAGALGGYTNTPEGKVVAASLLDNYNKIVISIRDQASLIRTGNESSNANASASTQAGAPVNAGDMLYPRINNVRIFAQASASSKVLGTVQKNEELIASGEVSSGFVKVDTANISGGWVQRTLISSQSGATVSGGAPAPIQTVALPTPSTMLYGTYSGSYVGVENGIFNVAVTKNGAVIGNGQSSTYSTRFHITGSLDANGVLSMTATGAAGAALFTGSVDQATGKVSGDWHYSNNQSGGTFNGQRM